MARRLAFTVVVDGDTLPIGTEETAALKAAIPNPIAWDGPSELDDEPAEDAEPPRGGSGSGEEVWRKYADRLGLEVPADASRDDIVALVDAHKTND